MQRLYNGWVTITVNLVGAINDDNAMNAIAHDNIGINLDMGKMVRNFCPELIGNFPYCRLLHLACNDIPFKS